MVGSSVRSSPKSGMVSNDMTPTEAPPEFVLGKAWSTWPRRVATAIGIALVISLLTSAQSGALLAAQGSDPPFHQIFVRHVSLWLFLPPLTLLVPWLWAWTRSKLPLALHVLCHIAASLVVAAAMANVLLRVAQSSRHLVSLPAELFDTAEKAVPRLLVPGVGVYWMVCAVSALLRSMRMVEVERQRGREAQQRADQLRDRLDLARYALLQRQIQPHFLFNTLNTVVGLLRSEKADESCEVVLSLSDLLRATLQRDGKSLVPLDRELELAKRYLTIQGARFGPRLSVEWDVEEATKETAVPQLILLTLVENTIEHALAATPAGIRVLVRARVERGRLELAVQDDGPGFNDVALEDRQRGIGLRNCRDRLRFVFGDDFSMRLGNVPGGGAVVEMSLPAVLDGSVFASAMSRGGEIEALTVSAGVAP